MYDQITEAFLIQYRKQCLHKSYARNARFNKYSGWTPQHDVLLAVIQTRRRGGSISDHLAWSDNTRECTLWCTKYSIDRMNDRVSYLIRKGREEIKHETDFFITCDLQIENPFAALLSTLIDEGKSPDSLTNYCVYLTDRLKEARSFILSWLKYRRMNP